MMYVERSADGKIVALHQSATSVAQEQKSLMDPEVQEFFSATASWKQLIADTDLGTIRILEDLIDVLISKKIIQFTELPVQAQQRIWERRRIREKIVSDGLIVEDVI